MSEGSVTATADGIILDCNHRFAGLVAAPPERVIGAALYDFVAAADEHCLRALLNQTVAGNQRISLLAQNGTAVPVCFSVYPLALNGQQHLNIVVTDLADALPAEEARRRFNSTVESIEDVVVGATHGLQIESGDPVVKHLCGYREADALGRAEEQLRLAAKVFEASGQGIMITDAQQRLLSVNRAFSEITGHTPAEAIGKTPAMIFKSGRHGAAFYAGMWRAIRATAHWQGEIWNRRKNGEIYPAWLTVSEVRDDKGEVSHYIGVFSDLTRRKAAEERIEFLAHYDLLTGLPNRMLLGEQLTATLAAAARDDKRLAVLLVDFDRFKDVNDSLGHAAGDRLLRAMAERLQACVRPGGTVARVGGDEFVVVLPSICQNEDAGRIAGEIVDAVAQPLDVHGHDLIVTSSIGIGVYPNDGADADALIKNADAAMYHAKEMGRNNFQYYDPQMNARTLAALSLEHRLRRALERQEFLLHYQPQVELASGRIVGVEALIRWQHPDEGLIPPSRFIPMAEERGLIVPLGEWVLREACRQNQEWQARGLARVPVAVNISAQHFRQRDFHVRVAQVLAESGLPAEYLELEVTENSIMRGADTVIATLQALRQMGLRLSIDDFGTGYSSLSYLKRFPVDKLKIAQSFVEGVPGNSGDVAIVKAIVAMAKALRLEVIAEGVETRAQVDFLRRARCDEAQGYYYSRPLAPAELAAALGKEGHDRADGDVSTTG